MSNSMDRETARAILGEPVTIRKTGGPPTFAMLKAGADLARLTKVATFADLQAVGEMRDWLPQASDILAQVLGGAVLADDPELSAEERMTAAIAAVDSFRDELLTRLAGGISKRYRRSTAIAKNTGNQWKGIL
jgi:hypothetical protein